MAGYGIYYHHITLLAGFNVFILKLTSGNAQVCSNIFRFRLCYVYHQGFAAVATGGAVYLRGN